MTPKFDSLEREKIVKMSQETLWNEQGSKGREYLFNNRKLGENVVKKIGLGYVPADTSHQLSNRIIFPVYDASNNLIAISSRFIENKKGANYWHERYNKSFYLYGINIAKESIRKNGYAVCVEGNFDVIQCWNHGLENVVGIFGTCVSSFHLSLLLRYCEKIIFVFDNDENKAGEKGIDRVRKKLDNYRLGSSNLIKHGFVFLEGQKDPDEYIKTNGINSFKELILNELNKLKYV